MTTPYWHRLRHRLRALSDPGAIALTAIMLASFVGFWMIFRPVLNGKLYLEEDLLNFNIPIRFLYAEGLRAGRIDIWTSSLFHGFYMHGEGQMGMFHPLHLLLYKFVPLTQAVGSEILINYLALWVGSGLLFYRWTRDWMAAWFGAFVLTFAGPVIPSIIHINKLAVLAHVPWSLLALDYGIRGYGRHANYAFAAFALFNGSAILLGHPPFFMLLLILQLWYAAYLWSERVPLIRLLYAVCAFATGLAIGAIQLLPTWNVLQASSRAQTSYKFLAFGSLYPINLLQWVNPYFLRNRVAGSFGPWEISIYAGIGPFLLFLWLCTRRQNEQKRLTIFLLALAVAGLFLALGEHNHLFRYYYRLPVLSSFRMPCRFSVLSIFALAGGSAIALQQLRAAPERPSSKGFHYLAACLLSLSVLTFLAKVYKVPVFARFASYAGATDQVLVGCLLLCAAIGLFYGALRYRGLWITGFCVLAVCDLGTYSATYLLSLPVGAFNTSFHRTPPVAAPAALALNVRSRNDTLVTSGYSIVNAYTGLEPPALHSMSDPQYLRALGVAALEENSGGWTKIPSPAPPVRFEQPFYSPNPVQTMKGGLDLAKVAVVSSPLDLDAAATGSVQIIDRYPGYVRIAAESSGKMLCVLVQRFDSGWRAEAAGKKIDLMPVDGDLTGFVYPGGRQEITLVFQPRNLFWGRAITYVSCFLLALAVIVHWLIHRNRNHPATSTL